MLASRFEVEFQHIRSHRGHQWNELADALCKAAGQSHIDARVTLEPPWHRWKEEIDKIEVASVAVLKGNEYPSGGGSTPSCYFADGTLLMLPAETMAGELHGTVQEGSLEGNVVVNNEPALFLTFNVQGLTDAGRRAAYEQQFVDGKFLLCGLQETRKVFKQRVVESPNGQFWIVNAPRKEGEGLGG